MRRPLALAASAVALFGASPADAATLSVTGGTLRFSAAPGTRNDVLFQQTGANTVQVDRRHGPGSGDDDPITTVSGCTPIDPANSYTCAGVSRIAADAGDGDDDLGYVRVGARTIPATMLGGSGNDYLGGGEGPDVLDGGDGDDILNDNGGADDVRGGAGRDIAQVYYHAGDTAIAVSLDDVANDGGAGEGDNVRADVEDVYVDDLEPGLPPPTVTLVGNDGPNLLHVLAGGASTITPGGGKDWVGAGPQNDMIDVRDGIAENVICGGGTDTVLADAIEAVSPDCEVVQREPGSTPGSTPTGTPVPPPTQVPLRPAVRAFKPVFVTRIALRGSALGRFDAVAAVRGLVPGSTVTLRCLSACSRRVRIVRRASRAGRVRLVIRGGLILRRSTRIELRVSRRGERTRIVRYRFVRRGSRVIAREVTSRLLD